MYSFCTENTTVEFDGEAIEYLPISAVINNLELPHLRWEFIFVSALFKLILGYLVVWQCRSYRQIRALSSAVEKEMSTRLLGYAHLDGDVEGLCEHCGRKASGNFCSNCGNRLPSIVSDA